MRRINTPLLLSFWLVFWWQQGLSQMVQGGRDTLYGNEWIREGQRYFKMKIGEDGVYRIPASVLTSSGIPAGQIAGNRYQLFCLGKEAPLYVSSGDLPLGPDGFLEFYARRNRGELDRFLYADPDREMLNPEYSMFSDTSAWFLTWAPEGGSSLRYRDAENDLSGALPPREGWFWDTVSVFYFNTHHKTRLDGQNLVTYSYYDAGEGFGSPYAREHSLELQPREVHTHSEPAELSMRLFSGPGTHRLSVSVNGAEVYSDTLLGPYRFLTLVLPVQISDPRAPVRILVRDLTGRNMAVSTVQLRYPRRYAFPGERMAEIQALPGAQPAYFELESFQHGGQAPLVFDLTGLTRIRAQLRNDRVAWTSVRGAFILFSPGAIRSVGQLQPVEWIRQEDFQAQYLIISHPRLMDAAREYADYRSAASGGGYTVSILDVEKLYDQFAYGVSSHPFGIKNMANWLTKGVPSGRHLLIIGKGYTYASARRFPALAEQLNLVPTFGLAPSDNMLVASGGKATSLFAVGRIAATNSEQVRRYLQKISAHEALLYRGPRTFEQQAWRKNLLHLSGGNPNEQTLFSAYLNRMAEELERNPFGAATTTVRKTSSDPVAASPTELAVRTFNNGVGIKNFLGHGGVTVTDFGLDDPEYFDNRNRLPLALSLGCLSGHMYTAEYSVSENFVLTPEKGTIGYVASCGYAFPFALANVAETFYRLLGTDEQNRTVGQLLQQLRMQFESYTDFPHRTLIQQFAFQGDPAIRVLDNREPDWTPDPGSLRISPSSLNTQTDSFTLSFTVGNLGRMTSDSLLIHVNFEISKDSVLVFPFRIQTPAAIIPVQLRIPLPQGTPPGAYRLWVELDPANQIPEGPSSEAEANNISVQPSGEKGVLVFISDNALYPLDPPDQGVWKSPELTLSAFTADMFAPLRTYAFELDTTLRFNSPYKRTASVEADGGVVSWKPGITLLENQVYFWRVQADTAWQTSSFLYAPGEEAYWSQSNIRQLTGNPASFLEWSEEKGWEFGSSPASIIVEANIFSREFNNVLSRVLLNNDRVVNIGTLPSLTVVVFDSLRGSVKRNISYQLDQPARRKLFMDFVRDSIRSGEYAAVLTARGLGTGYFEEQWLGDSLLFGQTIFGVLEQEGAASVRLIQELGPVPYAFAFRKGLGPIAEDIGSPESTRANVYFELPARASIGSLESPLLGPALDWQNFAWEASGPKLDSSEVRLYGWRDKKSRPVLLKILEQPGQFSVADIAAGQYPYIQAIFQTENRQDRLPSRLLSWKAAFIPAPEVALDPLAFYRDTLIRGDSIRLDMQAYNFSPTAASGIRISQVILGVDNRRDTVRLELDSLRANQPARFSMRAATEQLFPGENRLALEAGLSGAPLERTLLNNTGSRAFWVTGDQRSPLLDVMFDGERILQGAIVSPNPEIRIALTDENPYLLLQDTQLLDIALIWPDRISRRVSLASGYFEAAAQGQPNRAVFSFQPNLEQDGQYTLRIRARDRSGNLAGNSAYEIQFQVIRKSSLSNILPYPNPFSSSTRFVYTFTGSRQPERFLLRIMTVSGRIVREVRQEEFGPLKVGTHLSDFVWDGTDQFGERLANGVYVYQVLTQDEQGSAMETFETAADSFFRKGFGKIVLLR